MRGGPGDPLPSAATMPIDDRLLLGLAGPGLSAPTVHGWWDGEEAAGELPVPRAKGDPCESENGEDAISIE